MAERELDLDRRETGWFYPTEREHLEPAYVDSNMGNSHFSPWQSSLTCPSGQCRDAPTGWIMAERL